MPKLPSCIDCKTTGVTTVRPADYPGPRCKTHDREKVKRQKQKNHDRMVQRVYSLPPGDYELLKLFQNGTCALCRRATGATKALAVDHDHKSGEVRGLLCGPCNQMLGHGRDNPEFFLRVLDYLNWPPYKEMRWANEAQGDSSPGIGTDTDQRSPAPGMPPTMPNPRTI